MEEKLQKILAEFQLEGQPINSQRYGQGHINETYLIETDSHKRYILQKISRTVFPDVAGLMENIVNVTDFLCQKNPDPRAAMRIVWTNSGKSYWEDSEESWRVYDYVEGTISLQTPETDRDFYESAVGFGRFISQLADYPAATLHEPIPNFHNTPDRYRIFLDVLRRDPMGRAKTVEPEIAFALSHQEEMAALQTMRSRGELPLRVTHNDTKLNNVLLDEKTHEAVCVIDLDTVMPGLTAYDYGDSIRFGAATAAEDEQNLDLMTIDLQKYEIYTRGFVGACRGLTEAEIASLPLGAKTVTMECGIRFLTDYLDGDHYFAIHREGHNLDRARTQFRLVSEMTKKWDEMRAIVEKIK